MEEEEGEEEEEEEEGNISCTDGPDRPRRLERDI